MTSQRVRIALLFTLALALVFASACGQKAPPEDACTAPNEWFPQSETPPPDPNGEFNSFCAFHQWAWQSFLWLTQEDPKTNTLRFENFPTSQDVIAGRTDTDILRLTPRTMKSDTQVEAIDEINQAGQNGVLVDHNGRAVYYSQHVNQTMFDDIVKQQWNNPTILNEIPPETTFAVGDVVLKASWIIVSDSDDVSSFYVRQAEIDKLKNNNGRIVVDPENTETVTVALVGLHIVGTVKGHPEAIWATFEHNRNAPEFAADQKMSDPVSDEDWTFYSANTPAIDTNQLNSVDLALDEPTQTLTPITQVARQFPNGMAAGTQEKENDIPNGMAIDQLNASVSEQLSDGNPSLNYFEVGAVWGPEVTADKPFPPNSSLQERLVGSTLLSNSVIETFTQNVRSQNNCFACHNTLMFSPEDPNIDPLQGTDINWSHIVLQSYLQNQP